MQQLPVEALIDAVLAGLAAFCAAGPLQDDVSMVVMKVGEVAAGILAKTGQLLHNDL